MWYDWDKATDTVRPVTMAEAVRIEGERDSDWRRVAKTEIGAEIGADIVVSTVFLRLDHRFGSGPPVLFETMVFGGPLGEEQDRYCTHEEAKAGHMAMVERVKDAMSTGSRAEKVIK